MDHLKWATLKSVANINLTMLEPQRTQHYEHLRFKRDLEQTMRLIGTALKFFLPQLKSGSLSQNIGFERVFFFSVNYKIRHGIHMTHTPPSCISTAGHESLTSRS